MIEDTHNLLGKMKALLILVAALCGLAPIYGQEAPDLDGKIFFNNSYPQYLAFRGENRRQYQEGYDTWAASIGSSCGFMRKLISEELEINPKTVEWTRRYAEEHPEKLMMIHLNGEARQVAEHPDVRKRYFPGHWVYCEGSRAVKKISPGDTVVHVADVAPFTIRGYVDRRTTPVKFLPLQLIIVKLGPDGEKLWYESEYAVLKSYDKEKGTITVERGLYDTGTGSYDAEKVYIAPVAGGLWGKHVMWYYNLSSACPSDKDGRQAMQVYADEIVSWFRKGGELHGLQGIAFDVNYFDVSKKGPNWDVDNDGTADGGWIDGRNVWMEGDVRFFELLREGLGDDFIISADAQHPNNQQIPGLLNGMESEGLVQHDDMWRGFSRAMNTHLFWEGHRHSPYDYRYVVMKVMGPDGETRATQMRRFGAATAFCLGASVTAAAEGPFLPEEFSAPNSLGVPAGELQRYAKRRSPSVDLSGEELAEKIEVENGEVYVEDGAVHLRASGGDPEKEMKAVIKNVDIPAGDVTFFVKVKAVDGRTQYSEKYDIPRIMWLRPENLPVYDRNKKIDGYFTDLYGLFSSDEEELSYYFRNMPEGRQDIDLTVTGRGEMVISGLTIYQAPDIISREFEHGSVVVNPSMEEQTVPVTDKAGEERLVTVPPVDAVFIRKDRPAPIREMHADLTLSVADFGAVPDDGKNDFKAISDALTSLKQLSRTDEGASRTVRLFFPEGTYNIMPDEVRSHCFQIEGCTGFELDGNGADIVIENPQTGFISFSGCRNGIVRGFNVDYSTLPFTQGTVTGKSEEACTVDFRIDSGYPGLDEKHFVESRTRWGSVFTPDGSMLKYGYPNLIQVYSYEKIADDTFRIKTGRNVIKYLSADDRMAVIARYNGRPTYSASNCFQLSFIGNTNYAGPAGSFASRSSMINVLGCSVLKKEGRLISQDADCTHITPSQYGPWIEGNVFCGQMDDAINIKTELVKIDSVVSADRFIVNSVPSAGDSLFLFNPREGVLIGRYVVRSVNPDGRNRSLIELSEAVSGEVMAGADKCCDMFFNDARSNKGFVIRNNRFLNSRRFSMLIQATDGTIAHNVMENTSTGGIVLQNSASWPEGFVPRNVEIYGNRLVNCGYDATFLGHDGKFAPITIRTTTCRKDMPAKWQGVENILIEDNTVSMKNSPAIYVAGAKNIRISRNKFNISASGEAVVTENVSDVVITDSQ